MPTLLAVWPALVVALYAGYLALAPWLRRRPVRVTNAGNAALMALAVGPGLVYLAFAWMRGAVTPALLDVLVGIFAVAMIAAIANALRGNHLFFGATPDAFRDAWRAALGGLGHAYEPHVGRSGRVERVALTGPRDRIDLELGQGRVRGRGAAGREVAAEVAEAIDHYFDTHETAVDRAGTIGQGVAALVLLALAIAPLIP